MGSNNKRFGDDEERTMISDEVAAVPREARERVFQRSLSEEDITKFLPNTNEVPVARASSRVPGARASAPGARASAPGARPAASTVRSNVAKASAPGSQRTLSESPPLAPAPEADEESTHIFQGSRGEEFHAAVASKRNTLLKSVPSFEDNDTDHGGDESTLIADAAAMLAPRQVDPPLAAAKPVEAPSMLSTRPMEAPIAAPAKPIPEARKSAPPPAFARRVEPAPPPVNLPVVTPEPLQSTHSGSLAVAVSSAGENTADAHNAKAEGKRSMVPWAAAFAAVLLLAVGGSVVTMRHRAAAAATASFVDPVAHGVEGSDPVRPVDVPVVTPVAANPTPVQVPVPGAMPEAVANPVPVNPVPVNPVPANPDPAQVAAQPAPQPQGVAQPAQQPQVAAQPAPQQPQVATHAAAKPHAPQAAPHPVAVVERPAPAEKPQTRTEASAIAKKKGALTEEEKRAADEAKRLADKQLEQSL